MTSPVDAASFLLTISCSPSSLTSRSHSNVDAVYSSKGSVFGGYPYLMSKVIREVSVAMVLRRLSTVLVSSKLTTDCPDGPLIRNLIAGGSGPFRVKVKEGWRLEMLKQETQRPVFHDVKLESGQTKWSTISTANDQRIIAMHGRQ